ncbi:MAG: penicillin-binding protein 2 [bacterium]|nr:penicillin-binding protein 2 [bacterium]
MKSRIISLYIFFVIAIAAIIVRLFAIQILGHEVYQELAQNQHQLVKTLIPTRGEIWVKEGKSGKTVEVVTNVERELIYAVPPEIIEKEKTAGSLAKILEIPKREILEKITDNDRKWVALKKELPESTAIAIRELKLPGIYFQSETYRLYPEKNFAAQALGFLSFEGDTRVGRYGVEEYFQKELAGTVGSLMLDRDQKGRWITGGVRKVEPAQDGANIVLTIDRAIQFKAQEVLKSTVVRTDAESGSIVVVDPKTGAVLAMANYPDFDLNLFNKVEDIGLYRNQALADAYEPGSVFKPITMAAGIDAEAISPQETYEDTGQVILDKYVIKNALERVYGQQTMTQVLEQSINTGVIYVVNKVGAEKFLDIVKKFGFGSPTGVTLPAESGGNIKNLIGGGEIHYSTASFGQGITVTAMQLATAFGAIANEGRLAKPRIVENTSLPDGTINNFASEQVQVISPKAAHTLSAMLVSVVENGHGKRAGVPGYYIAGKTGTAQVARQDGPGYDPDKTIGTFAGFGPVPDPAFAMVVKIVNPRAVRFAESSAAPAFGELAQYLVNYFQIPPTRK